jgi:adenosylmethionine-8-amino-7-oxononanoate aminotransferase
MCRQAASLTQQSEEKKLLLAALGSIPLPDSLGLVTPHLDDATIKDEACAATVAIAEQLLKGQNAAQVAAKLIEPLQKAAAATANADLAGRAKGLLQQAQSKAGVR